MDFVERIFGVSPDGGSGVYEALVLLIPLGLAALWMRRRAARRRG
jgi:hypothetical protein